MTITGFWQKVVEQRFKSRSVQLYDPNFKHHEKKEREDEREEEREKHTVGKQSSQSPRRSGSPQSSTVCWAVMRGAEGQPDCAL